MSQYDPIPDDVLKNLLDRNIKEREEQQEIFDKTPSDEKERVAMYLLEYCDRTGERYNAELINDNPADPIMAVYYQLDDLGCYCDEHEHYLWDPSSDSYKRVIDENDDFFHLTPLGKDYLKKGYVWDSSPSLRRFELQLANEANTIAKESLSKADEANSISREAHSTATLVSSQFSELVAKESERNVQIKELNKLTRKANEIADSAKDLSKDALEQAKEANRLSEKAGRKASRALIIHLFQALFTLGTLVVAIIALCKDC